MRAKGVHEAKGTGWKCPKEEWDPYEAVEVVSAWEAEDVLATEVVLLSAAAYQVVKQCELL